MLRSIGSVTFLALFMVGCGGGDKIPTGVDDGHTVTYTVGGTVTGLSGLGLVLNSNFGGDLAISASGSFTFSTRLPVGATFNVQVASQPTSPPAQYCQVANGTGTIPAANVMSVKVTCGAGYTVGGTVSGLVGSGLTLAICTLVRNGPGLHLPFCHNPQQVGADGAFTLGPVYPADYSGGDFVFIDQQPTSPTQSCFISYPTIRIQNANDTSVTVSCTRFSYVTNAADNTLSAYSVDATTGALAAVGTPIATGASPQAIVDVEFSFISAPPPDDTRYVFVGNGGSNDVSVFSVVNTTGALTAVPGSPFPAGINPQAMVVDSVFSDLYVANAGSNNVSGYSIDSGTGALTPMLPATFATGKNPTSIVMGGRFVFVANHGGSNDISAFSTDIAPGGIVLTPIARSPFLAGGNPLSLAVGAGGKFLYSANPDATKPTISGFRIDSTTGALSPLSGSPFRLPVSQYMAADQTGAYLYVTSGATIAGYAIDATTGALTALRGFPVAAGANAYSVNIDSTNRFLYVTDDGAATISGFSLDASTGALTPMPGSPFPAGSHPQFIATF
jgi:6-phosphogluconolactonase (cycloisomerase 2 family)